MRSGFLYKLYSFYKYAQKQRPYLVDAVQTASLMGTADFISQTVIEKNSLTNVDFKRVGRFASIGLCVCGPVLHIWYGSLHRLVGNYGSTKTIAVKKVLVDQGIFAPIYIFIILTIVDISRGKDYETIKSDMEEKYFDILKVNYMIWPLAQLINFYFIPVEKHVIFCGLVSLVWDTYLAWKTNRPRPPSPYEWNYCPKGPKRS